MRLVQQIKRWREPSVSFSGEASPLPGTPDVVVSHGVYSHNGIGTGAGRRANRMRLRQLYDLGYSAVMCTVDASNAQQINILRKEGWIESAAFISRRTQHGVVVFFRVLSGEE